MCSFHSVPGVGTVNKLLDTVHTEIYIYFISNLKLEN